MSNTWFFPYYCGCRDGVICGQAFREYSCKECGKGGCMHHNTDTPRLCDECSDKLARCQYCQREMNRFSPREFRIGIDKTLPKAEREDLLRFIQDRLGNNPRNDFMEAKFFLNSEDIENVMKIWGTTGAAKINRIDRVKEG